MSFPVFNKSTGELIDFNTKEERNQYASDKIIYQGELPELVVRSPEAQKIHEQRVKDLSAESPEELYRLHDRQAMANPANPYNAAVGLIGMNTAIASGTPIVATAPTWSPFVAKYIVMPELAAQSWNNLQQAITGNTTSNVISSYLKDKGVNEFISDFTGDTFNPGYWINFAGTGNYTKPLFDKVSDISVKNSLSKANRKFQGFRIASKLNKAAGKVDVTNFTYQPLFEGDNYYHATKGSYISPVRGSSRMWMYNVPENEQGVKQVFLSYGKPWMEPGITYTSETIHEIPQAILGDLQARTQTGLPRFIKVNGKLVPVSVVDQGNAARIFRYIDDIKDVGKAEVDALGKGIQEGFAYTGVSPFQFELGPQTVYPVSKLRTVLVDTPHRFMTRDFWGHNGFYAKGEHVVPKDKNVNIDTQEFTPAYVHTSDESDLVKPGRLKDDFFNHTFNVNAGDVANYSEISNYIAPIEQDLTTLNKDVYLGILRDNINKGLLSRSDASRYYEIFNHSKNDIKNYSQLPKELQDQVIRKVLSPEILDRYIIADDGRIYGTFKVGDRWKGVTRRFVDNSSIQYITDARNSPATIAIHEGGHGIQNSVKAESQWVDLRNFARNDPNKIEFINSLDDSELRFFKSQPPTAQELLYNNRELFKTVPMSEVTNVARDIRAMLTTKRVKTRNDLYRYINSMSDDQIYNLYPQTGYLRILRNNAKSKKEYVDFMRKLIVGTAFSAPAIIYTNQVN